MNYLLSKSSLDFGEYGDFSFTGLKLKRLDTIEQTIYQSVYKFLKSNFGDYELQVEYAANLSAHLGKGLDLEFSRYVENKLKRDIINQGLVPEQVLEVYSLIEQHTLHLRVILFDESNYTISVQINNSGVIVN